jgi:hypothetical protein
MVDGCGMVQRDTTGTTGGMMKTVCELILDDLIFSRTNTQNALKGFQRDGNTEFADFYRGRLDGIVSAISYVEYQMERAENPQTEDSE